MQANRDDILKNLEQLRATQGEAAYTEARDALAMMLIGQPRGEDFLKSAFPDLDLEPIRRAAAKVASERAASAPANDMLALIRTHCPHLQTQAQLDAFMVAFNAFTLTLDTYFAGDIANGDKARDSLVKMLDLTRQLGVMGQQVTEIPIDQRSAEAAKLTETPKLFTEAETQKALLAELKGLFDESALNNWYKNERARIDGVVSQTLRNELFDAIRAKQISLAN